MAPRRGGFTLLELLIVVIIVIFLAGLTVSLMNVFTHGQSVRQSANIIEGAINLAAQHSRSTLTMHFVVLENKTEGIEITIYKDKEKESEAGYRVWDITKDERVKADALTTTQFVRFIQPTASPAWVGMVPRGGMVLSVGFTPVETGAFENGIKNNSPAGEIVLEMPNQTYKMYMDLDVITGKVRKSVFWAE